MCVCCVFKNGPKMQAYKLPQTNAQNRLRKIIFYVLILFNSAKLTTIELDLCALLLRSAQRDFQTARKRRVRSSVCAIEEVVQTLTENRM